MADLGLMGFSPFPYEPSSLLQKHSDEAIGYRSGMVNSNTVNSKFHLIQSYCQIFFLSFP